MKSSVRIAVFFMSLAVTASTWLGVLTLASPLAGYRTDGRDVHSAGRTEQ